MTSIFQYLDYRKFLHDYYVESKAKTPHFSYEIFMRKVGFKSKSLLHHIIDGKRNLSKEGVFAVAEGIGLTGKSFSYFQDLVAFNHAKSQREKAHHFVKLTDYNSRSESKILLRNQYEFYSHWYYNTIRELLPIFDFKEDFERLGKALHPPITAEKARRAVKTLVKLGLIRKTNSGYVQEDRSITTGDEVQSLSVQAFHLQNLNLAGESMDTCGEDVRDVSCLVATLSTESFALIKSEIKRFRKKLMQIADKSVNPSRVYHLSFQFFPTSQDLGEMKP